LWKIIEKKIFITSSKQAWTPTDWSGENWNSRSINLQFVYLFFPPSQVSEKKYIFPNVTFFRTRLQHFRDWIIWESRPHENKDEKKVIWRFGQVRLDWDVFCSKSVLGFGCLVCAKTANVLDWVELREL
jgi:hypothetical protein